MVQDVARTGCSLSSPPADQDEERDDKERDLDARADGDAHREVELVLAGDGDSRDVLGRIAADRKKDQADPLLRDTIGLGEAVD
jgi:hypothetical protein